MNNSNEEVPLIARKIEPVPPPLPSTTATNHPKGCMPSKNRSTWIRRDCSFSAPKSESWDRLFDEAYRADVKIYTDNDTIINAHANILGFTSPVFRSMIKKSKNRHRISIRGVPPEAVRTFIRYLYTSCYEVSQMEKHVLSLLVLSHAFAVPQLKRECEHHIEQGFLNVDNVIDVFQLSTLCDAPRLSIICHRFVLKTFKVASTSPGWKAMKSSNPHLEKKLLESMRNEDRRRRQRVRKMKERKVYVQLYEAMEALVHICRDGCRTIGPHDKMLKEDQEPCKYAACKVLESLLRHFAGCKLRVSGGCAHCKRMWQLLELHARICANSDGCKVPLCRKNKQRIAKERKKKRKRKEERNWKILVRKILRTKGITGAPYFTMA
ncbi:hypothetical protein L2E82_33730 [Cichorium intybus]|uniref:Uncharacterized protein n=1 Tax=Cichorium intybus TaxID=13427 RepID=A0ACB9BKZ8_CICIN|nr:hypothetical protein L2E82_33730 [Cichorium intybus]